MLSKPYLEPQTVLSKEIVKNYNLFIVKYFKVSSRVIFDDLWLFYWKV